MSRPAPAEIEREPLCRIEYCPAPNDPDWHACLHCGSTTIEHHHVEGRGKKRTLDVTKVVPLCVPMHKDISLNEMGDAILTLLDGSKLYRIFDLHNETIHESKPWWMQPKEEGKPWEKHGMQPQQVESTESAGEEKLLQESPTKEPPKSDGVAETFARRGRTPSSQLRSRKAASDVDSTNSVEASTSTATTRKVTGGRSSLSGSVPNTTEKSIQESEVMPDDVSTEGAGSVLSKLQEHEPQHNDQRVEEQGGMPKTGIAGQPTGQAESAAEDASVAANAVGALSSAAAPGQAESAAEDGQGAAGHPTVAEPLGKGLASAAPSALTEDWSALSDDELQLKFDTADAMQGMAFLIKCKSVAAYRDNHVQTWGESWTEHAYGRFLISRRTLYAYANIWEISVTSRHDFNHFSALTDSRALMTFIGRKAVEDGKVAMEAAVAYLAAFGEPPTVPALVQRLGEESGERASVKRWSAEQIAQERQAWHRANPEEHAELGCGPCGCAADLLVFMEGR